MTRTTTIKRGDEGSYRWVILAIATYAFFCDFFNRASWPAVIPVAVPALHISNLQAGLYVTAFQIGYLITQLPSGVLSDIIGSIKLIAVAQLTLGTVSFATGFINNYPEGLILRILSGLGGGMIFSPCVRLLYHWFAEKERGRATGIFFTGINMGLLVANFSMPTLETVSSWRVGFWVPGIASIAGGIITFVLGREHPETASNKSTPTKSEITRADIKYILTSRDLWLCSIGGFCVLGYAIGMITWGPEFLSDVWRLGTSSAGIIMGFFALMAIIGSPIGGYISDIPRKRKYAIALSILAFLPFPLLLALLKPLNFNMALTFFLFAGFFYNLSSAMNVLMAEIVGPKLAGSVTGFSNAIWQLGGAISPIITGILIDASGGYTTTWLLLSLLTIPAAICFLLVREPTKTDEGSRSV